MTRDSRFFEESLKVGAVGINKAGFRMHFIEASALWEADSALYLCLYKVIADPVCGDRKRLLT